MGTELKKAFRDTFAMYFCVNTCEKAPHTLLAKFERLSRSHRQSFIVIFRSFMETQLQLQLAVGSGNIPLPSMNLPSAECGQLQPLLGRCH